VQGKELQTDARQIQSAIPAAAAASEHSLVLYLHSGDNGNSWSRHHPPQQQEQKVRLQWEPLQQQQRQQHSRFLAADDSVAKDFVWRHNLSRCFKSQVSPLPRPSIASLVTCAPAPMHSVSSSVRLVTSDSHQHAASPDLEPLG